jgi:type I restriction enzyme S subunit
MGIRDAGANHGGIVNDTAQHTNALGLANSAARLLPKDTVCLSRTASVGYVVKMGRDMATSQDFVTWSCVEALDPDFLMKALLSEGDGIRKFGEGSTHTTIYFPEVKAFHVALPPLPEQRRIIAKIDSLTAKSKRARDHLDHIPRLVEKYKQAVLAAAFRGDLTREWRREHPVAYPYPAAPLGSVLADIRYGTAKKCSYGEGRTPVPRIPNIQNGTIVLSDLKSSDFDNSEYGKLRLSAGDLLLIRSNGSLGLVGQSAVVDTSAEGMLFAGYLIRLRFQLNRLVPKFAHFWMHSPEVRSNIERAAKSTSGVNNINSRQLEALQISLPHIDEQNELVHRIETAFAWIDRLAAEATSASKLVDKLDQAVLAKAFRGELVPQDPNDEPASVLLDRIRAERAGAPKARPGRRPRAT